MCDRTTSFNAERGQNRNLVDHELPHELNKYETQYPSDPNKKILVLTGNARSYHQGGKRQKGCCLHKRLRGLHGLVRDSSELQMERQRSR